MGSVVAIFSAGDAASDALATSSRGSRRWSRRRSNGRDGSCHGDNHGFDHDDDQCAGPELELVKGWQSAASPVRADRADADALVAFVDKQSRHGWWQRRYAVLGSCGALTYYTLDGKATRPQHLGSGAAVVPGISGRLSVGRLQLNGGGVASVQRAGKVLSLHPRGGGGPPFQLRFGSATVAETWRARAHELAFPGDGGGGGDDLGEARDGAFNRDPGSEAPEGRYSPHQTRKRLPGELMSLYEAVDGFRGTFDSVLRHEKGLGKSGQAVEEMRNEAQERSVKASPMGRVLERRRSQRSSAHPLGRHRVEFQLALTELEPSDIGSAEHAALAAAVAEVLGQQGGRFEPEQVLVEEGLEGAGLGAVVDIAVAVGGLASVEVIAVVAGLARDGGSALAALVDGVGLGNCVLVSRPAVAEDPLPVVLPGAGAASPVAGAPVPEASPSRLSVGGTAGWGLGAFDAQQALPLSIPRSDDGTTDKEGADDEENDLDLDDEETSDGNGDDGGGGIGSSDSLVKRRPSATVPSSLGGSIDSHQPFIFRRQDSEASQASSASQQTLRPPRRQASTAAEKEKPKTPFTVAFDVTLPDVEVRQVPPLATYHHKMSASAPREINVYSLP